MGCNASKKHVIQPIISSQQPVSSLSNHVMTLIPPPPRPPPPPPPCLSPSFSFSFSSEIPHLILDDYKIERYLASGGIGIVYLVKNHSNNIKIALKFFGYIPKLIDIEDIINEINTFHIIKDLKGIAQIKGICYYQIKFVKEVIQ